MTQDMSETLYTSTSCGVEFVEVGTVKLNPYKGLCFISLDINIYMIIILGFFIFVCGSDQCNLLHPYILYINIKNNS